ncbi:PREDICTED: melanoma-associated antigen B16-like [Hipposideros armiger]|uniref:Melanoma-associated antigen B16-like n=1 Tax=Hipposideros armiger TaxID=186990 RepID=A0A8B7Q1P1_HIPAR|nr:PREDICTED: melanoma-associated antigen B16-like [Hipposideros armiger]
MSQRQKIPYYTQEQHHAYKKTQGLEVAQVSKALEETHLASHPLMPGNSKEALAAGTPSTSQSPQRAYSSNSVITVTSSRKSDEPSDKQRKKRCLASSKSLPDNDTEDLTLEPLDEKATLLLQFLLHKYQMNEPITKADMMDAVIKEDRDAFPEILRSASEYMELVFGIKVEEVDRTGHCYTLVNKLGLTYDPRLNGEQGIPKTSLLMFILGVIFIRGNRATEEEIWGVLNTAGLYSGKEHSIFGEPRKFITKELVWEKYLEYQQVPNSDPPRYEFLWGPRAHAEASKMKLLEFLTKIHQSDPTCFPSKFEEALRNEAERGYTIAVARAGTTAGAGQASVPHPVDPPTANEV